MNWKSIIIILLSALTFGGCAETPPPPKHKYHTGRRRHTDTKIARPTPTPIEKIVIIQQTPPLAYTPTPAPTPAPTATPHKKGEF